MRAGIDPGQGNVAIAQMADPVCGDRDIVVKNLCASICGTEVAVYCHGPNRAIKSRGRLFDMKCIPGGSGGQGRADIAVGDIVSPPAAGRGDTAGQHHRRLF